MPFLSSPSLHFPFPPSFLPSFFPSFLSLFLLSPFHFLWQWCLALHRAQNMQIKLNGFKILTHSAHGSQGFASLCPSCWSSRWGKAVTISACCCRKTFHCLSACLLSLISSLLSEALLGQRSLAKGTGTRNLTEKIMVEGTRRTQTCPSELLGPSWPPFLELREARSPKRLKPSASVK